MEPAREPPRLARHLLLPPVGDKKVSDTELWPTARRPFRSVNITVREGLPASIFRASLIASLLGHTPAQRRSFFGTSFTDKKHPTVGYLNMRELPPWSSTSEAGSLLSITELMTQSLPYLDTRNVRPAQAPRTSAGPPTSQAEMLAFPNVLVLDGTGFLGGNAHDRLKYLGLFAHASTHLHLVDQLVIITITGDHAFEHLLFPKAPLTSASASMRPPRLNSSACSCSPGSAGVRHTIARMPWWSAHAGVSSACARRSTASG